MKNIQRRKTWLEGLWLVFLFFKEINLLNFRLNALIAGLGIGLVKQKKT